MANIIKAETLEEGIRNVVIRITIKGDGTGDEAETVVIDPATFASPIDSNNVKVMKITPGSVRGFDVAFIYESTDSAQSLELASFVAGTNEEIDWTPGGGNINLVPGATGKILMTTTGLSVGDVAVITFYLKKRSNSLKPL